MVHLQPSKGHQFFALRVDQELQSILFQSLSASMNHIDVGFSEQYRPELEALVASAYYLFAYVLDRPTPGMAVFQLALQKNNPLELVEGVDRERKEGAGNDFKRKALYRYLPVLVILAQYIHKRLDKMAIMGNWRAAPRNSWKYMMYKTLKVLEICFRVAGVANTLLFLWFGVYPTLLQRISGVQMVNDFCDMRGVPVASGESASASNSILQRTPAEGYSPAQVYLKTRQIGWSVLTQFMGTLLWVFDWPSIRLESRRLMRRAGRNIYSGVVGVCDRWMWLLRKVMLTSGVPERVTPPSSTPPSAAVPTDSDRQRSEFTEGGVAVRPQARRAGAREASKFDCACCGVSPAEVPYEANCSHIYCYSCIYHITKGFTVKNQRRSGLIRSVAAGDGEAEEKRRDRAIGDPFRNSLGLGSTELGEEPSEDVGRSTHPEGLVASASTGAFIGVADQGATASDGQADDAEDDAPVYLCPICDTSVEAGERFTLN